MNATTARLVASNQPHCHARHSPPTPHSIPVVHPPENDRTSVSWSGPSLSADQNYEHQYMNDKPYPPRNDSAWVQDTHVPRNSPPQLDVKYLVQGMAVRNDHTAPRPDQIRSEPDISPDSTTAPSNYRLHSERQLEQRSLDNSSHAYDRNVLSKIGGPNAHKHRSSVSSSFASPTMSSPPTDKERGSLHPQSARPDRQSFVDAFGTRDPTRASSISMAPTYISTSAPQSTSSSPHGSYHGRSSVSPELSRATAHARTSINSFEDTASLRIGNGDPHTHLQAMDEGDLAHKTINAEDRFTTSPQLASNEFSPRSVSRARTSAPVYAGTKRRASSSHREDDRTDRASLASIRSADIAGQDMTDGAKGRQYLPQHHATSGRYSPLYAPDHRQISHPGSVSSISSATAGYRQASLDSPAAFPPLFANQPPKAASRSPSTLPSIVALDPELRSAPLRDPRYPPPLSELMHHPHPSPLDNSGYSGTPLRSPMHWPSGHPSTDPTRHPSGTFICDCCPKKPKRFVDEEDLRLHHMEKQYTCAYCPNRFKNKNEAERHQNSLHLRRYSWSCAALINREDAFSVSPANGTLDICGFCGEEFPHPPNWQHRFDHLNVTHKFGECNQGKKFFRADHFRQHLKHSHAGTSGKWTNMLENTCMKDEPPPVPMDRQSNTNVTRPPSGSQSQEVPTPAPVANMSGEMLLHPRVTGTMYDPPDHS